MWVKIYSPNVKSIEIVKRAEKRARRARLYYMRYVIFAYYSMQHSETEMLMKVIGNPRMTEEVWRA